MYTQCPNCAATFLVTAEVLKQASGKVRCGGCENVFNSLLYLSEQKPGAQTDDASSAGAAGDAASMSEEQARQLEKTVDDLAGPDVRLEDTGVEWLLLADDEADIFGEAPTEVDAELSGDSGDARIDELLDDSPSPVDEFLTATPSTIDVQEVFGEGEEPGSYPEAELRFDDNSGLPDSGDAPPSDASAPPDSPEADESGTDDSGVHAEAPADDLAFGDAEEWGELLDEPVFGEDADELGDAAGGEAIGRAYESSPYGRSSSAAFLAADDEDIPALGAPEPDDPGRSAEAMIDRELMDVAITDESGFASTIVLGDDQPGERYSVDSADSSPGVETIIMEGDTVRTLLEQEALDAGDVTASSAVETGFMATAKRTFQGRLPESEGAGRRTALFALGGVVLGALLAGQLLHRSRAELATVPEIRDVIDPVYRTLGSPVTPDWNVRGWRFEVTRGSTVPAAAAGDGVQNGGDEILTIYSRVGNRSSRALPYPVIVVSLTNRFEETIGSAALEPREYLAGDVATQPLVPAGATFNAVASIQSPPADATGFKLNVCYRRPDGLLRCATNAFR